jgi:threonine synthase
MPTFKSTRGSHAPLEAAVLQGLATDGGLYMPNPLPRLGPLPGTSPQATFAETAAWVCPEFFAGHLAAGIAERLSRASLDFPAPVVEVEAGVHVLELFHGPTHAFKDVGARFMARLMAELNAASESPPPTRTVLVATSGDTGGAVANAFHGLAGLRVIVLFPSQGISPRQRRQMTTLGDNITAVAVRGSFDDCQRLTKEAFATERLRDAYGLTSANSINVARLLPQAFYYVHAAATLGTSPRFVVPCGNLGNLCAGLLAYRAGMPASGFLAASNVNDVFSSFLRTGVAEERDSVQTVSNAMDVGRPSNLERIQWLFRDDPAALPRLVKGDTVDDVDTRACIAEVYRRTGYVLDPHAAVAYRAQERHRVDDGQPTVVLATAHPAKFPEVVEEAIGRRVAMPEGIASVMDAEEHYIETGATLAELETVMKRNEHHG